MATLIENLTNSLIETRQRYAILKDNGIESMSTIYPSIPSNGALYHQLLATLPKEIDRLEQRIMEIKKSV
ncbi:hypothetical protein [Domibacillus robiginosus]|uniref:hypothetical protein n=1 Tax=Domibacillus robiginosus TaxID=1071054 RepID=UPI00067CE154|nr:hypothetical protein [Domibacillus robiginosus]